MQNWGHFHDSYYCVWGAPKRHSCPFTFSPNHRQFPRGSSHSTFHGDVKMRHPNRWSVRLGESAHMCSVQCSSTFRQYLSFYSGQTWLGRVFSCVSGIWTLLKDIYMTSFAVEDGLFNPGVGISEVWDELLEEHRGGLVGNFGWLLSPSSELG